MTSIEEDIDLHSMIIGEAPPKLPDLLQAAVRAGLYRAWIVHVKRSDSLPREVGRCSSKHPLVVTFHILVKRYNGATEATRLQLSER